MRLRMWTYDLAREQSPSLEHLRNLCRVSLQAGYNALGLYLEHRFAYASTPWAHGDGALTPETVRRLRKEFPELQLVPFINLLGHTEGFLYTEEGSQYAEARFAGLQSCPSKPEFRRFCEQIVDDTLAAFDSEIVHIGGDETWQLGQCPTCRSRVEKFERDPSTDGKALLYGEHFGVLARMVAAAGRRPAVWGDMFFDHPQALDSIPKSTLIFDWQYFKGPEHVRGMFLDKGFEVVFSPTLHVYNAAWMHLPQSEENVRQHAVAASRRGVYGVCVTTWECGLFGNYETVLPAVVGAGRMLQDAAKLVEEERAAPRAEPVYESEPVDDKARSIAAEVADTLITQLIEGEYRSLRIRALDDVTLIESPANDQARVIGQLPAEQGDAVSGRIVVLAQMPMGRGLERRGVIRGTYLDTSFKLIAKSLPNSGHPTVELEVEDPIPMWRYHRLRESPYLLRAYLEQGELYEEWARLMGSELQDAGGLFAFSGRRSSLKCRLLLYSNPFLFWLRDRDDLCGEPGDIALDVLNRAVAVAPDGATRGVSEFVRSGIEFVRFVEIAHQAYAKREVGRVLGALTPCRQIFDSLSKTAKATHLRIGGSLADIERCRIAKEHVERVIRRVKEYGDGSLGYLPSFEMITHPKFVPHDQAGWWLINSWANE